MSKVGLVVVSHSAQLACGVVEVASQMASPGLGMAAVGGPEGHLGCDPMDVAAAIASADSGRGVAIFVDLGSSVLAVQGVLADRDDDRAILVDAPLLEGVVSAAVVASTGADLDSVVTAAERTWHERKL